MKKSYFLGICFLSLQINAQQDYALKPVNFTVVKLQDGFWMPRIETNRRVTIPASFERCESTGRVKNFVMAAARSGKFCTRYPFDDTDIYKTIEGASYSLATHPDKKLESYLDSLIAIIGKAQEPDGYLYTARTIDPINVGPWLGKERWEKEREHSHELYNAGHLYEAAAAHYLATQKRNLLDIAIRNADLVCSVFGPGKKHVAPGHEVVEMGLVKLYRITGKKDYLETARFFVKERGHYTGYDKQSKDPWKNGSYWQDDKPVVLQEEAVGHAVRAGYLYAAVADVAALSGDDSLLVAIDRIWNNVIQKKFYVQGGIGAKGDGERFGDNYELPNATAYNETCAAIANIFWNQRMFLLHGDAKYIDVMEKTLYNGMLSGVGLDGKSFFYTNAMEVKQKITKNGQAGGFMHDVESTRSGWFECSCCPTNVARMLPALPGYVYAVQDNRLYVNLFIKSNSDIELGKTKIAIEQQNNYPWDGKLVFRINPQKPSAFEVMIRIPGWARNQVVPSDLYYYKDSASSPVIIKVNGSPVSYIVEKGYAIVHSNWKKGDIIEVNLPMEIRAVYANSNLSDNGGRAALQRGPIVYCAEWTDNNGRVSNLILPAGTRFEISFEPLLGGIVLLKSSVPSLEIGNNGLSVTTTQQDFTAIPYCVWANRGAGEMMIWMPERVGGIDILAGLQRGNGKQDAP